MITIQGMLDDPDIEVKPLFPDEASYEAFRERYVKDMEPKLKAIRKAHIMSEHESRFRKVD